ncbi:hypothetical protein Tco_0737855, partial [Tanacetum coccineum]
MERAAHLGISAVVFGYIAEVRDSVGGSGKVKGCTMIAIIMILSNSRSNVINSQDIIYTIDMFRNTLQLPVETLENPFVAPVNIEIIESFMHTVGYQGVLFHDVINHTNVDYAALLWWDFMNCVSQKKDVIQYPRFTKLIIAELMKKFPSIPPRLEEDYHSIKDDILLVSVFTTRNVTVRGMLILDAFLIEEIRATDDYKEYETVFVNVVVPMNQLQPVVSTQGTHRSTPRAHRTPTLITASDEGERDNELYTDKFAAPMIHDDVDDSGNRIKPESLKEHPKHVDDDDGIEEEKKDEKKVNEMGSLEIRTEKMQT